MRPIALHRHILALAGVVIAGGLLSGCAGSSSAPEQRNVNAKQLYVQGALAYQEGDRQRALEALHNALKENPDLIMARFLLGNVYRDKGQYAEAAEQYRRVTQLDPYSYKNFYMLGLMEHLLNRLQEAAGSYLRAVALNPEDPKSNMNLGLVYTALGKPEMGIAYSKKAAQLDPKNPEASANLGVVLDALGSHGDAELSYRRALEMDPSRTETLINLASSLMAQKRFKDAIPVYERALEKSDTTLVRQRYGFALLQAGRTDDAMAQFKKALEHNPQNYQALNGLGDAMMAQYFQSSMLDDAKRRAAVDFWQKSLAVNPNQERVKKLVAEYADRKLFQ